MNSKAYAVDLHIHSCLSPCGDEDMTPNNIVNMALLKGLDFIAVTDHNSAGNLPAVATVAKEAGLGFLPGIEVNTKEEIHVLAYLPDLERAMVLDEWIMKHLPNIPNREDFFGKQQILNDEDEWVGNVDRLLIHATDLSVLALKEFVEDLGGAVLPAHVDRKSFSMIANLGFFPENLNLKSAEVSSSYVEGENPVLDRMLAGKRIFRSSDAHYLHQILERIFFVHLEKKNTRELLKKIQGM